MGTFNYIDKIVLRIDRTVLAGLSVESFSNENGLFSV